MEDTEMTVEKMVNGEELVVKVAGRIDTTTAKAFEEQTASVLEESVTSLVMDFAGVDYISSAGLRVVLVLIKRMKGQGSMRIINANEMVKEIFEVTGFTDLVEVE